MKELKVQIDMFDLCSRLQKELMIEQEKLTVLNLEESEKQVVELNPDLHYLGPIVKGLPEG